MSAPTTSDSLDVEQYAQAVRAASPICLPPSARSHSKTCPATWAKSLQKATNRCANGSVTAISTPLNYAPPQDLIPTPSRGRHCVPH